MTGRSAWQASNDDPLADVHLLWRKPQRAAVIVTLNGKPHRFDNLSELYTGDRRTRFLAGVTPDGAEVAVMVTPPPTKGRKGGGAA